MCKKIIALLLSLLLPAILALLLPVLLLTGTGSLAAVRLPLLFGFRLSSRYRRIRGFRFSPQGLAHRSQHQGGAVFRTKILGILIDFMAFGTGFHDLLLYFFRGCLA